MTKTYILLLIAASLLYQLYTSYKKEQNRHNTPDSNPNNNTNTKNHISEKQKRFLIIILLLIIFAIGRPHGMRQIISEKEITLNTAEIEVVLNDYNITSQPIGLGEYSIGKQAFGDDAEFRVIVRKNTNTPWSGAVELQWDLYDINGIWIGKAIGKGECSLRHEQQCGATSVFKINDNGKITYNQKEISKFVLSSVVESDALHSDLESSYLSKKFHLNDYLENKEFEKFNSLLASMRVEYTPEEFPNQHQELNEIEEKAKLSQPTDAPTLPATTTPSSSSSQSSTPVPVPGKNINTTTVPVSENQVLSEDDYKKECINLTPRDYEDLMRHPENYTGKKVCVSGVVTQFIPVKQSKLKSALNSLGLTESKSYMAITHDGGESTFSSHTYIIAYNKVGYAAQLLEGDYVTVYGEFRGTSLSEMTSGVSHYFPVIDCKYTE